ncbi:MFS transporter [Marinobacterium sediminicola]|uniref:MFS-type transporter involved in bile tolerance, Atg22 family n=1 Tax=Marinobacterium sediminicola TaxID=518898 RepID=A0ABY1S3F9_9GAMM|nr:MFS transporter [Marinobacterium sediminicola]ULG68172.1 MFS transporter [Marinobacterium sediminicola]SMR77698.1 MFS-type transporter involved in bile tolerance, Atg22 family [Marinobacterium sediminicola]
MEKLVDNLYTKLANEEDARACKDISPEACREVPGNFARILFSQFLTKLGDAFANPKVVLPALLQQAGAPLYLIGFLVPIRESGSLIPQLLIANHVRRLAIRKHVWVLGSVVQAVCMLAIALSLFWLQGAAAGWTVIVLLIAFSLARGLCSVASKDVIGKTIPKPKRGRLSGLASSLAGAITLMTGLMLYLRGQSSQTDTDALFYAAFIALGGTFWLMASALFARVEESPGETDGGINGLLHAFSKLKLLKEDRPFRHFVLTRSLLLCTALSAPYYVILSGDYQSVTLTLGIFVITSGLAGLISGPFWGLFADRSSRQVMIVSALIAATLGLTINLIAARTPELLSSLWLLPAFYFLLTISHEGVRIGRKTYLVNMATGNRRTDYVSVSNTFIGVVLLLIGLGCALSGLTAPALILVLSLLGMLGAVSAYFLSEVED